MNRIIRRRCWLVTHSKHLANISRTACESMSNDSGRYPAIVAHAILNNCKCHWPIPADEGIREWIARPVNQSCLRPWQTAYGTYDEHPGEICLTYHFYPHTLSTSQQIPQQATNTTNTRTIDLISFLYSDKPMQSTHMAINLCGTVTLPIENEYRTGCPSAMAVPGL